MYWVSDGSGRREGRTYVSLDELGEVAVPDLKGDGVREQVDSTLVDLHPLNTLANSKKTKHDGTHLEALLPVLVLFQEVGKVDDGLGVGNLEFKDLVVHGLGLLDGPDRFLEVDVE